MAAVIRNRASPPRAWDSNWGQRRRSDNLATQTHRMKRSSSTSNGTMRATAAHAEVPNAKRSTSTATAAAITPRRIHCTAFQRRRNSPRTHSPAQMSTSAAAPTVTKKRLSPERVEYPANPANNHTKTNNRKGYLVAARAGEASPTISVYRDRAYPPIFRSPNPPPRNSKPLPKPPVSSLPRNFSRLRRSSGVSFWISARRAAIWALFSAFFSA